MFKIALTTAFVAVSLSFAMAGGALANGEDAFRDRCQDAGGTFTDGSCKYPDGSTEVCQFGEDDWGCYRDNPSKPVSIFKNFGKLINIPVKIVKTPTPPGPVAIARSTKLLKVKPSASVHATTDFATQTKKAKPSNKLSSSTISKSVIKAPSAKLSLSAKTSSLKFN